MKKYLLYYIFFCFCATQIKAQENKNVVLGTGMQIDRSAGNSDLPANNIPVFAQGQDAFVYPNPATDHIWIVFSADNREIYKIALFDMNGRVLYHQDYTVEAGVHKYNVILPPKEQDAPLFVKVTTSGRQHEEIFRILRQ